MTPRRIIVVVRVHRMAMVVTAVLMVASACGDEGGNRAESPSRPPASESDTSSTRDNVEQDIDDARPPDVVIRAGDRALTVSAHSFCYAGLCADGTVPPPSGPPDAGAAAELFVEFPIASWSFEARFVGVGTERGREQTVALESQPDGRWRLGPAGAAGTYDIWLTGRGDGGDAGYVFRWMSTEDGA